MGRTALMAGLVELRQSYPERPVRSVHVRLGASRDAPPGGDRWPPPPPPQLNATTSTPGPGVHSTTRRMTSCLTTTAGSCTPATCASDAVRLRDRGASEARLLPPCSSGRRCRGSIDRPHGLARSGRIAVGRGKPRRSRLALAAGVQGGRGTARLQVTAEADCRGPRLRRLARYLRHHRSPWRRSTSGWRHVCPTPPTVPA